ncbi:MULTISPECIES: Bug family tripartite tricarboxylate transporter substrate binding protein [Streptomyces]|uniref:Tricarboxylate transport protein TctC n=1 Tax=Streptomyces venezuelae (strain ATCC 10712 / CBS 650.69 / DSM 40230 / JCM 4526 / NBRC 13096 / PD 04745) TaxID=953739 RepID=F2RF58_STRVP|nr:tripartite tricarboxylate transporter substrate binding protein [Streptomyces venezuelae]APE20714.1 C4-dicarboxylate ABC transporter substrate-binding protein [Streptomyces venezuelae]QER98103.1 tripartite tricarboxylate transporter substrate binding protein [Streptomyces venezuelae ATCC 10712]QES05304.1 tripartite tricarboxylate transporter substrate binding protein [Streptomyces venezuelae]CCA54638.1 Tricarboxylate transport protein TctC [Streptomyces venezuelae ATCC 10712]
MRLRTPFALLGAALLVLVGPPLLSPGSGSDTGTRIPGLRLMVPNTPGGGYDITARTAAKNAEEAGLTGDVEVFNLPGAGGTVGLTRLVGERGNGRLAMSMGLGVVGAVHTNETPRTLADTTPIARLTEEQDIVVVGKDSPYRTIQDLLTAWKANPGKLPVGGGSSPGGPDHLAPMLMAQAAGIAPKDVNYVPFDGGGELLASILGDKVAFGVSGVGEYLDQIKAGELRLLAVTGPKRVPGLDAPTLREAGLDTEFTNWRGIVAPPGLSDAEREKLVTLVTELHDSPQWRESLKTHGWNDAFLPGEEFGAFLAEQDRRVGSVLKELGL